MEGKISSRPHTYLQGLGTALYTKENTNSAAFKKLKQKLLLKFYYCLSPRLHVRSKNTNPLVTQAANPPTGHQK
jgi:hypothetical protein